MVAEWRWKHRLVRNWVFRKRQHVQYNRQSCRKRQWPDKQLRVHRCNQFIFFGSILPDKDHTKRRQLNPFRHHTAECRRVGYTGDTKSVRQRSECTAAVKGCRNGTYTVNWFFRKRSIHFIWTIKRRQSFDQPSRAGEIGQGHVFAWNQCRK